MIAKTIYFVYAMLILDFVTISGLRKILLDFLRVENSRKNANKIYANQPLIRKISLSFIKGHLKKHIKVFTNFHRVYIGVIYTLFPQYIIFVCCNAIMNTKSIYVLFVFAIIKLILCFMVRINVDANHVSIYRNNK